MKDCVHIEPMSSRFSHSKLELFADCPQKFSFKYIDKVEAPTRRSVNLFTGELLHQCLERLYKAVQIGKTPQLDELMEYYNAQWEKESEETLDVIGDNMTLADFRADGEKALTRYYAKHMDEYSAEVMAVEHAFTVEIDPEREIKINGKIDRIDRNADDSLTLVDYKYSNQVKTQPQIERDPQLALYTLAARELWPQFERINVTLVDLKRNLSFKATFPAEMLDERKAEIIDRVLEIQHSEKLEHFPTRESPLCSYCEYFALCPAKRHSKLLEDELTKDEMVVALQNAADEYIRVWSEEKRLQSRKYGLRSDIIKFATELGANSAYCDIGKVTIRESKSEEFPSKSKDRETYEKISQIVRSAGEDVFEMYADVNLKDLAKAVTKEQLPQALTERLRQLLEEKKSYSLYAKANVDFDSDDSESESDD